MILAGSSRWTLVAPFHQARVERKLARLPRPVARRISERSSVVLPAPLRPMSAIFSPRDTLAVKLRITGQLVVGLR